MVPECHNVWERVEEDFGWSFCLKSHGEGSG